MQSNSLTDDDRIRIRSLLLEFGVPFEEFQIYDRWENNSDLRKEYWKEIMQLNDFELVDRLPRLDLEKLLRLPYWSLKEACGCAVGWPVSIMEIDGDHFITPGVDDGFGLENAKEKYDELLELAVRAADLGDLKENNRPKEFIQWAAQFPMLTSDDFRRATNDNPAKAEKKQIDTLSTKERRTALIIIYSLARAYGWSAQGNSDAVGKLAGAIETLADSKGDDRLKVSDRTIRKWLFDSKKMIDGND